MHFFHTAYQMDKYLFKVNNKYAGETSSLSWHILFLSNNENTIAMCKIGSKLTKRHQNDVIGVIIVNFDC